MTEKTLLPLFLPCGCYRDRWGMRIAICEDARNLFSTMMAAQCAWREATGSDEEFLQAQAHAKNLRSVWELHFHPKWREVVQNRYGFVVLSRKKSENC